MPLENRAANSCLIAFDNASGAPFQNGISQVDSWPQSCSILRHVSESKHGPASTDRARMAHKYSWNETTKLKFRSGSRNGC